MTTHRAPEWGMLIALAIMWGSAFTLTKVAVGTLDAELVVAGRLLVACLLLAPAAYVLAERPPRGRKLWVFLVLIAIFGYALPFSLVSWGQRFIDSGLAGILMAVMPLATLGLAHFLVPGERITLYRVGGFLCGLAGVVVLMGPAAWIGLVNGDAELLPMLAVLGGAISYAISSIMARLRPASDPVLTAAVTISLAAIIMVPPALEGAGRAMPVELSSTAVLAVVTLGVFSTAMAAILYFKLVTIAGPSFVSQLNYLIPLWAVGSGIVFLGERPEMRHLTALGLILGGILITQLEHLARGGKPHSKRSR